jgi:hypothetical protein
MTLRFPNDSRSYDADRGRIRFWGHDDAIEVPFFLEEGAIFRLSPKTLNGEAAVLAAFDAARERICEIASRVYRAGSGRSFYVLAASDF